MPEPIPDGLDGWIHTVPRAGRLTWIGLRSGRREPVRAVDTTTAEVDLGLTGDRFDQAGGKRQVTLIQAEHLPVVAALAGLDAVDPADLRRNLVVAGLNVLALKHQRFRIGTATFEGSGACPPCSRMDEALGPGGFQAMRGHGGITARVITAGTIQVGDAVEALGPA